MKYFHNPKQILNAVMKHQPMEHTLTQRFIDTRDRDEPFTMWESNFSPEYYLHINTVKIYKHY